MKSFSELTSASQVNNEDLLAISQTSGSGYASKKTTVKDITDKSNLNLAEEYDSTSTYAVDDYVIYESVLYKCIGTTTGTFDSTKWTSVVVTDEMGSGGGGGTGGHTIIDENGNSMTARAGLQFTGGANVSDDSTNNKTIVDLASAGGIDGVFIDTGNVIVQETQISASGLSYTATEDCFVSLYIYSTNDVYVKIDDAYIVGNFSQVNGDRQTFLIPLKKGQTLTTTSGSTNNTYTVYGIQTGTTQSKFQPVIYSLEEREIGVWTDGKPLYEKTIPIQALQSSAGQTSYPHSISNIEHIIDYVATINFNNANGTYARFDRVGTAGNSLDFGNTFSISVDKTNINIIVGKDRSACSAYVTVRYTKSTDVAGSGSWTPQGVPAVHYSTDEHIIGTWIDGSTIYEKTIYAPTGTFITVSDWTQISGFSNIGKMIDTKINVVKGTESRSVYQRSDDADTLPRFEAYNGGIYYYTNTNTFAFYNWDWYITFQYTKSS